MKKYYRISMNWNSSPVLLMISVAMSLFVMMFINGFMGSLGGIPALVGFFTVVYLLRGMVNDGNCISHQLSMTSKSEVLFLFLNYALGYALVWGIVRILTVIARITGWGTIEGMSVYTYFHNLYGTSVLERWAYIFTAILMYAFIISLFPVIVIHKKRIVALYMMADSVIFMGICYGIRLICRYFIRDDLESRAKCVLDDLLLCQIPKTWEMVAYMVFVLALVVLVAVSAIWIAAKFHGPKPGKTKVDEKVFPVVQGDDEDFARAYDALRKKHRIVHVLSALVALVLLAGVAIYMFLPQKGKPGFSKVAECLTKDSTLGPMVYGNDIYVKVDRELDYHETGTSIGYLGYKGQNCDSRFYRLAIANLLYKQSGSTMLEMYGDDAGCYELQTVYAQEKNYLVDDVFFLWDEDWEKESASHKGTSGYSILSKDSVLRLLETFPNTKMNVSDFEDYDAYFTIQGYVDANQPLKNDDFCGNWVGCILVKDNAFYFCNYENLIDGKMREELLEIVGGNTNGGNPTTQMPETEDLD